jgi:tRNA threonylcarbamoyladenosine biosynthesis protein TsaE
MILSLKLDELATLSKLILEKLPNGGVVILQGDVGAGKTTLTQNFAQALGVLESVTSPTFSLQQHYGERLFHYDMYNHDFEKFRSLGMLEELEKIGFHLIEWGDEALKDFLKIVGFDYITIKITQISNNIRQYEVIDGHR